MAKRSKIWKKTRRLKIVSAPCARPILIAVNRWLSVWVLAVKVVV
jgi:hypothetical protein